MTDHSAAVQGIAAGVGGAILSLLGIDAPTLTWALIGCVLGVASAKPSGRMHATCLFVAAVCASAEVATFLGPALAGTWGLDAPTWRKGLALAVGVLLHPLTAAATEQTPKLVDTIINKFGGGRA